MSFDGIKVERPNPDGLDPVYQAYQILRRYFELGKVEKDDLKYEDGSYAGTFEFLVLPTGDAYPMDDATPLDYLEDWLVDELGIQPEDKGRPLGGD